jgi:trimeric autotransporter adhesin
MSLLHIIRSAALPLTRRNVGEDGSRRKKQNMNMKTKNLILILILIIGLGVLPKVQALSPAPDGGYPGRNTAEGQKALFNLTTGTDNAALGQSSLQSLTTGNLNTGVGAWTLALNTADYNTACGAAALLFNGTGTDNTAVGTGALLFNTIGEGNTATGAFALYNNTEGDFNTANGEFTLYFNTTGERNTAIGGAALYLNTEGSRNTAIGNPALLNNTTGNYNTAIGAGTLFSNNGSGNTAIGADALHANTTGSGNTATGDVALFNNVTGLNNTANGYQALYSNATGTANTAIGFEALSGNNTGDANTALGSLAGVSITGSGNVCIGQAVFGEANVDDRTYIRNVNTLTQNFSAGVNDYVTVRLADGRLGHSAVVSSRRYKEDIKPLDKTSQALYALKPVSFRLKKEFDPTQALGFGLIAEEVEKVDRALVYRNDKGQVESVRYEMVNAMLLNEFLKEHRKVEEQDVSIKQLKSTVSRQEATIAYYQKGMEAVMARLNEQTAQIQKISAQIESNRHEPRQVVGIIP